MGSTGQNIRDAVALLDAQRVDFEYDGDMSPDVALDRGLLALYPFCRVTGPANVLVVQSLHSAHIAAKLAPRLGHVRSGRCWSGCSTRRNCCR